MPRSHNTTAYPLDHQFLHAHRTWLAKFRAELAAFMGGRGRGRYLDGRKEGGEDWSSWEADIRTVVELMEGRSERLLEEAADWREAIGAYGVLCDAGLRRDDLP
jgi:nuclear pore complex protein Nup85